MKKLLFGFGIALLSLGSATITTSCGEAQATEEHAGDHKCCDKKDCTCKDGEGCSKECKAKCEKDGKSCSHEGKECSKKCEKDGKSCSHDKKSCSHEGKKCSHKESSDSAE